MPADQPFDTATLSPLTSSPSNSNPPSDTNPNEDSDSLHHQEPNSKWEKRYPDHSYFQSPSPTLSTSTLTNYPNHPLEPNGSSSSTSAGHRLPLHLTSPNPRGVITRIRTSHNWLTRIQQITHYTFRNSDLLEEALESTGSLVTTVGTTHRHIPSGNRDLASVGHAVMKLLLTESCYTLRVSGSSAHTRSKRVKRVMGIDTSNKVIKEVLGRENLALIGTQTKIEYCIRPMKGIEGSLRKNPVVHTVRLWKDDVRREERSWTIARGVEAVVGAVYFDGGLESVKGVMEV
ncbi:hypothetical protein HYALB_00013974 [Hymenoscyphus albidus]|uniref:RNase III domain-containing protein n=1 Tax=Hymenoscyphus albidus TaxID=595503 RepID=A0A9N9Q151_9HELO|nr:hypothetical protein HYALB_00013974 [Hymenoscyphus albidus]